MKSTLLKFLSLRDYKIIKVNLAGMKNKAHNGRTKDHMTFTYGRGFRASFLDPLNKCITLSQRAEGDKRVQKLVADLSKLKEPVSMLEWFTQNKYWPGIKDMGGYYDITKVDQEKEPTKSAKAHLRKFFKEIEDAI